VASRGRIQRCLVLHHPLKKAIKKNLKILLRKKWERPVVCATKEQNMGWQTYKIEVCTCTG